MHEKIRNFSREEFWVNRILVIKTYNRDKNAFYGIISKHKVAEEGISEFNDRLTEITQIETQEGKKKKKVENNQKKVPTKSVEYQSEKTIIRIPPLFPKT